MLDDDGLDQLDELVLNPPEERLELLGDDEETLDIDDELDVDNEIVSKNTGNTSSPEDDEL